MKDRNDQEWLPDEALEIINCERITDPPERNDVDRAKTILERAVPMAAKSVAWLALHSGNEQVRLRASQYIIDGVIGGAWKTTGGEDDLLMALVNQLQENDDKPNARFAR